MKRMAPRIAVDDAIRFGRPVVEGTRVPVDLVVGRLAGGLSVDQVCAEYDLTREDVLAVLAYAAAILLRRRLRCDPPGGGIVIHRTVPHGARCGPCGGGGSRVDRLTVDAASRAA